MPHSINLQFSPTVSLSPALAGSCSGSDTPRPRKREQNATRSVGLQFSPTVSLSAAFAGSCSGSDTPRPGKQEQNATHSVGLQFLPTVSLSAALAGTCSGSDILGLEHRSKMLHSTCLHFAPVCQCH